MFEIRVPWRNVWYEDGFWGKCLVIKLPYKTITIPVALCAFCDVEAHGNEKMVSIRIN